MFKHTNVGISLKRTNTIQRLTRPKTTNNLQEMCEIYKLTCIPFKLSYTGQTNRPQIQIPRTYRIHKIKWPKSAYAVHILYNNHEYGCINTTTTFLKQIIQTSLLIPYEEFCIYSHCHHKELIPEQYTNENNPMYQMIFDPNNKSPPARHADQHSDTSTS